MQEVTYFARCRSKECLARIFWALNPATRKQMPVDAEPVENGNVVLIDGGDFPTVEVYGDPAKIPTDAVRYVSHFATCVAAAHWRTRRSS